MSEYEGFFSLSLEPMVIANLDGTIVRANRAFYSAFGWTKTDLEHISFREMTHPDDREKAGQAGQSLRQGHPVFALEYRVRCKDGEYRRVSISMRLDRRRKLLYVVGRLLEMDLFPYRLLLDTTSVPAVIVNASGVIQYANTLAETLLGYDPGELTGVAIESLIAPGLRTRHKQHRRGYHARPSVRPMGTRGNLRARRKDGSELTVSIALNPVQEGKAKLVIASILDQTAQVITERTALEIRQENERLLSMAQRDALTNIYNRRALDSLFASLVEKSLTDTGNLSLVLLDIDHFKAFNDQYGHHTGDQVLKTVVEIVQSVIRDHDLLVRYGGEEFLVVMPNCGRKGGYETAERIRLAVEQDTRSVAQVTVSLGVATCKVDPKIEPAEALLKMLTSQADQALYWSKAEGRNCTRLFEPI
jgi:diguanylate cyclase (GGDEF)-like protein/PAS domain S-box-containing protein